MHLEFLLEEASMANALEYLVPRILPADHSFDFHPHQGKIDLIGGPGVTDSKLMRKMRGYAHWGIADLRVCVVVDRDDDDCVALKQRILAAAEGASVSALCRIAIEELEAWFFGDPEAITRAYPRVTANLGAKARYRNPDAIAGGTWEALERELQRAGYYATGLPKVEVATTIAQYMDPDRNASRSFQIFRDGLRREVGGN